MFRFVISVAMYPELNFTATNVAARFPSSNQKRAMGFATRMFAEIYLHWALPTKASTYPSIKSKQP
jgi:hypothetical protein